MKILGVYNPSTRYGKVLKYGGACIISDNEILVSISEERITRKKYDYGYKGSIEYCLDFAGLKYDNIDLVVTSSCCEYVAQIDSELTTKFKRVITCPHHLSHAYSAYFCSDFENAIIVVLDGGGNTLEEAETKEWWKHKREQVSIYSGINGKIKLIERYFLNPYDTGFGEAFRYFTKYLGFGSSYNAGKVMALSSYVKSNEFDFKNIFYQKDNIISPFFNNPLEPIDTLKNYLKQIGLNCNSRCDLDHIELSHKYIAFLVQWSYQLSLRKIVEKLILRTGIKNVCISGGLGLNCIANSYILRECNLDNIFVQPASSDTGQCLGNAIFGHTKTTNDTSKIIFSGVYLGKSYDSSILEFLTNYADQYGYKITELSSYNLIASYIAEGNIIGWFQGRSEFGPRALGNRSILADPRHVHIRTFINSKIKVREDFMPFAASVLSEHCDEYFIDKVCEYMTLAPRVNQKKINEIPAVVHIDGTCRAQKVCRNTNMKFYKLLQEFYSITGVPLVLNTSLNGPDDPICETPEDALNFFRTYPLDYLVIENHLICKTN